MEEKYIDLIGVDCHELIVGYEKELLKLDKTYRSIDRCRNHKQFNSWVNLYFGQILDKYSSDTLIEIFIPGCNGNDEFRDYISPTEIVKLENLPSNMKQKILEDVGINIDVCLKSINNTMVRSIFMDNKSFKNKSHNIMTCVVDTSQNLSGMIEFFSKRIITKTLNDEESHDKYLSLRLGLKL